jgi:hypothetical protein
MFEVLRGLSQFPLQLKGKQEGTQVELKSSG